MKRKLVLFDIDGTLLLSQGAGRRAILAALADSLPDGAPLDGVRFDGKTDPQIVVELLAAAGDAAPGEPARIRDVLDRYVALLEVELRRPDHRTEVLPGVLALLESLEALPDVALGLLTGNVRRGAWLKLHSARIDDARFPVGAFGCDDARRPALPAIAASRAENLFGRVPAGADVVIIGDTPADVACGAGIGARAIAVATGGYSEADLRETGAHAVFPTLQSLDRVLEAILW